MIPFSKEACIFQLRLTVLGRSIEIATDSAKIHEILANAFGSRFFKPTGKHPEKTFYCSVYTDSWDFIMAFPEKKWLCKATERPSTYNLYIESSGGVVPQGRFSYDKSPDFTSVPTDLEVFSAHFQRMLLEYLLQEEPPSFRLVHGGALAHDGKGLLMLGATKGGKSTLTLASVLAGMQFLSDDHIPVDLANGIIHPFPRMLRLRAGTCQMLPDFASLCTNCEVDAIGETRYFLHPENLRPNALGEPVKLTHVICLRGFADEPRLVPAKPFDMAYNCAVADFYAPEHGAMNLVWQWGGVMDADVKCADLYLGHPKETAKMLITFMENRTVKTGASYAMDTFSCGEGSMVVGT